jgi:quercetin dioxygenase-like cupin family protein
VPGWQFGYTRGVSGLRGGPGFRGFSMGEPIMDVSPVQGPVRVEKPWGHEIIWARTERYVGKLLHIKAGHQLSLQYHKVKDETVHVQRGQMKFRVEEGGQMVERIMNPGDSYHITPNTKHRMIAVTDCDVLEASTPELDDVVRLEDSYGRTT